MCENICLADVSWGNGAAWTHYANTKCSCFHNYFQLLPKLLGLAIKLYISLNSMLLLHLQ